MAESEKKDSSTGNAKEKMSLLDEDFSKDFLSSWKSGTDDMDFSFEPVSKGKKKAFDFGMDMDFSLDDAFGKMPSFKMDLPDIDFSNSPNKSKKSKEKSEDDSAKGKRSDKHDKFSFSFDFDGVNINDGEKEPGDGGCFGSAKFPSDTINTSAASVQKTNDGARTELSVSEDIREESTHTSVVSHGSSKNNGNKLDDHSSSCTKELIKSDSVMENSEKNAAAHTPPRDHDDSVNGKNRKEVSVNTVKHNGNANGGLPSLECEKMTNNVKISGDMDFSLDDAFGKMSSFKMNMPDVDFPKSPNKSTKMVENSEEVSAKGKHQDKHDKFTYTSDSDGMNTSDGKNEHGHGGSFGSAKLSSDAVNTSDISDTKAMFSIARSSAEMQKPVSKASSTTYDSGPTSAKTVLLKNKVPGAINSKFPAVQATNEGGRTEFSASEGNREGSTHPDAVSRSCSYGSSKQNVKDLTDRPSSCTKELIQSDSITKKSEKDAAAHTPSRDHDDTVNGEEKNEASVDTETQSGKAANGGLPSLECEKMTNTINSSGFRIPSSTPPEQGTKFGNQRQGNLKDKISSIALTQKLNISQGNKLSSQRIDKKTFALPSLKITRRTTTDKHPAAPIMLSNVKSLGIVEKSTGPQQAMIKMVSPTISVKQLPTPSLKRKSSEAADMGPPKLHTPKRFSPNESRMSQASVREPEDGVKTQVNSVVGSTKNISQENKTPKFQFDQETNMAALQFSLMVENDANIEKAEACAKELDNICNMLKKKHEEAKELLVRALVNNNNLLMLNHPIYEEKISAVQRLASKLMSKELEVKA
ncbi:uncharacterized protein At4g18490-like isoform X2 [Chenopodium quinoa]|uniref:uncharacterized protein At4g18490-like isoform X2 n=1 Tax=Chenopodium quinoa TaxID=63459 RepID=UPI000B78B529|nr:uncharacterized protein At4g18490-like isoform X2 [Chenopodium quinoa]